MKQLIQLSLIMLFAFQAMAQQTAEEIAARAKEREIKTSGDYLYGESVADTREEAIQVAKSILASEINREILTRQDWQHAKEISDQDMEAVKCIDLARGSKMRAIAYVRKDGIEAIFDKGKAPGVILEEEKVEKESAQTKPEEQPVIAEETPEEIVEEQTDVTEFVQQAETPEAPVEIPPTNNPVLDEILSCQTLNEVSAVFENYKKKGKLVYGKTGTNLSSENSLLMLFKAGEIIAFLDKGKGTTRKNLLTGEQVSTHSFNTDQIWFQIIDY